VAALRARFPLPWSVEELDACSRNSDMALPIDVGIETIEGTFKTVL
jgi:hypothetical protein